MSWKSREPSVLIYEGEYNLEEHKKDGTAQCIENTRSYHSPLLPLQAFYFLGVSREGLWEAKNKSLTYGVLYNRKQ